MIYNFLLKLKLKLKLMMFTNSNSPSPVYHDIESGEQVFNPFDDKIIRQGFIRKVYSLLTIQLMVTCSMGSLFIFYEPAKTFAFTEGGQALMWISIVGMFAIIIGLSCFADIARKFPHNYLFLGLFTLCCSYLVGIITSIHDTKIVALAAGITMIITFSLTLFACQTKYDFTGMGGALLAFLMAIIVIGLINIFVQNSVLDSIYAGASAFIFSLYIIYDTQLIVGGKHRKFQYEIDDYVFAAISIYLDIINLFLALLDLFNNMNR